MSAAARRRQWGEASCHPSGHVLRPRFVPDNFRSKPRLAAWWQADSRFQQRPYRHGQLPLHRYKTVFQRYCYCDRLRQRWNLKSGLRSDQRHSDRGPRAISRFRRPRRLPVVSGLGSLRALRPAPAAKAAAVRRAAPPEGAGQLRNAGDLGEALRRARSNVV